MSTSLRTRKGIVGVDRTALLRRTKRLVRLLGLDERELSVLLTDDAEMAELNRRYRGRSRTTDVLAFSQLEGEEGGLNPALLGDVVISVPTAARQARERRLELTEELTILLVHGVLHLLGYEHEGVGRKEQESMRREQDWLVEKLRAKAKSGHGRKR